MPLLWLSLCFLIGLVLGSRLPSSAWGLLAFSSALLCPLLSRLSSQRGFGFLQPFARRNVTLKLPLLLLLTAVCLGAWRISAHQPLLDPSQAASLNGQGLYRITGIVAQPPELRDSYTLLRIQAESAGPVSPSGQWLDPRPINGQIQVLLRGRADLRYGDRLTLTGTPQPPPSADENDSFSYADYLARQGVYSYLLYPSVENLGETGGNPLLSALFALRDAAYQTLYRLFPAPEAPLLAGILLGIESDLPPDLVEAFQVTGTAHIIAISGFNIAILAGLFARLFNRLFSRWWAALFACLGVAAYTLLVGASPSVVRAAIMGSLAIFAHLLGRKLSGWAGLNGLAFTAALMCLPNPLLPWDASFQLSFSATLGLVVYGDLWQHKAQQFFERRLPANLARRIAEPISEYLLLTLAAQLATLPVILYHFQRFSISAVLVNPLVLPAQPLLMILSGLAVLVGLVWLPLGQPLALLALPFSTYSLRLIEWFAAFDWGSTVPQPLTALAAFTLLILVLAPGLWSGLRRALPQKLALLGAPSYLIALAAVSAAVALRVISAGADGQLHLTLLDQGGAPVALVKTPGGKHFLINSGTSANRMSSELGQRLSPLDHRLDGLILADCQPASLASLPTLVSRYPPAAVYWACPLPDTRSAADLAADLRDQGIPSRALSPGESLLLEGEVLLTLPAASDDSAALALSYQNFRALLPGSLSPDRLAETFTPTALLLDGRTLNDETAEEWSAFAPQFTVFTSPAAPALELPDHWAPTTNWGWLRITTDGAQMWVEEGQ